MFTFIGIEVKTIVIVLGNSIYIFILCNFSEGVSMKNALVIL